MSSEKILPVKATAWTSLTQVAAPSGQNLIRSKPSHPRKIDDRKDAAAFGNTAGNFFQIFDVQLFHNELLKPIN
jgi:hypothetical protein